MLINALTLFCALLTSITLISFNVDILLMMSSLSKPSLLKIKRKLPTSLTFTWSWKLSNNEMVCSFKRIEKLLKSFLFKISLIGEIDFSISTTRSSKIFSFPFWLINLNIATH